MTDRMARRFVLAVIAALLLIPDSAAFAADEQAVTEPASVYERVIAHGGGSYRGYETTNSLEAVNNSIAKGFKVIELDMDLSSDGRVIMLHDWDRTAEHYFGTTFSRKLSQRQFSNLTVYGKLEVLTLEKLAEILEKHKDIRIVTDTKGDNIELLTAVAGQYPKLIDRFIPQIYDYDQWDKVKGLGFKDIIFTMYAMAEPDLSKLSAFVKEHDIYAVAMPDYFAKRGYCRQLSGKGIKVYIHPVSGYEEAQQFFKLGAFGVYSGSLLPDEFSGIEKDLYLTVTNSGGAEEKLTDEWVGSLKELKLHGLNPGDTLLYSLDQSTAQADDSALSGLTPGKHRLTVKILEGNTVKGTLDYYLWKEADDYRIVHKKYEYRLDAVKKGIAFHTAMSGEGISQEAGEILEHSLIAKQGESIYYYNGCPENYMNGEELLAVQKGSFGKLLLPFSDTLKKLGADSVTMDKDRDISIIYGGEQYRIMADSSIIRKGFLTERLNSPVVLYLNKAMAGAEFYSRLTGRAAIERDGLIILLPVGASAGKNLEAQLFSAAGKLYQL